MEEGDLSQEESDAIVLPYERYWISFIGSALCYLANFSGRGDHTRC
jgi:hypothetical protein